MRRLPLVILVIVALVAVVMGCSRAPRYDSRLVAADSLMHDAPDSALAIIDAVSLDSLATEADHAYRDLLLTQARYKCYIVATTDSDINRALNYYRRHDSEREKLTRAYIYKGTVMEELGHLDSALLYYKQAENTAAPTDYFNLGYSKLRIAELYQAQVSQDSAAINRLYQAISCFETINDSNYLIVTMGSLGSIYGTHLPDSTRVYLNKAINLAKEYKPSLQYTYKSKLAGLYLHEGDYQKSKALAMDVLKNGAADCGEELFFYYAALSYIKLGLIDSAKRIIQILPKPKCPVDSMNYCNVMAELSKAENRLGHFGDYATRSKGITTTIMASRKESVLTNAEKDYNYRQLEGQHSTSRSTNKSLSIVLVIALLSLIVLGWIVHQMRIKLKKHQEEKAAINQELESTLAQLTEFQQSSNSNETSRLVSLRLEALKELYHDIRIRIDENSRVKQIVPLSALIKMYSEQNKIRHLEPTETFWEKMKESVNGQYNNIVNFVEQKQPELNIKDIRLFCLLCADLSPQIIKICMDYTHEKTASNVRTKLIHKMGYNMNINQFIEAYMKNEIK